MMIAGTMTFCTTTMTASLAPSAPHCAPAKPAPSRCCWIGAVASCIALSKRTADATPNSESTIHSTNVIATIFLRDFIIGVIMVVK